MPFFGWAMWATKHIIVDRSNPLDAVRSLGRAKERIAAGVSIVVFPEGTRSRDGKLQRFKKGGFLLAVKTRHEHRPGNHQSAAAKCFPPAHGACDPGAIEVIVDKPIATEGFRPGNLRVLSDQVHQRIAANLRQPANAGYSAQYRTRRGFDNQNLEKQGN